MTVADMRKKTPEALAKHAAKLQKEIADLTREKRVKEEKDVRKVRNYRKEIARALTVHKELSSQGDK